jgi:hypothetical protein
VKVEDNATNADQCLCPECPTYDQCMGDAKEALYCSRGKTACEPVAKSCMCGGCPVWAVNALSDYYYCMQGAAG